MAFDTSPASDFRTTRPDAATLVIETADATLELRQLYPAALGGLTDAQVDKLLAAHRDGDVLAASYVMTGVSYSRTPKTQAVG